MTHQLNPLTFPLHGTRLIEASAGTGKTYTIAALYLRLVLGHGGEKKGFGRALTPPEILVMTFTNAATQELRDRIRTRLTEAAAFFRDTGEGDPYLAALRKSFPSHQQLACARVLDQAAQWMDEAAIYTIHSWSQRMLRQHAFDSGSLFDLELEPDDQALWEDAACDYWRVHFYPLTPEPLAELLDLINCSTPQQLLDRVRPLLALQSQTPDDPFIMIEQRRQAIENARLEWAPEFDGAVEQVRQARLDKVLNGTKYKSASLEKWLGQLASWIHDNGPLPDETARERLSQSGLKASLNKNRSLPEHPAFTIFDRLNERLSDLRVDLALFSHAAREIARRFQQEKQRRGQMGYDDLLTRLNGALQKKKGGERLARVISRQYPVALIDEFQDTDPVQYATFGKVYLGRPGVGLFMIGDPKQAIYAFRGADIHTYLNARRETASNRYTLGKNYRSTLGMVQSVNQMFSTAAGHPSGAFMFEDEIPFESVAAQGHNEQFEVDGKPVNHAMHLWRLPQSDPIPKTGENGYLVRMADAFAAEIAGLLNLGQHRPPRAGFREAGGALMALRPADIAVLVRTGDEARAIRQALDQRSVRSVYLSDKDSIYATAEAREMLYLLRACCDPKQEGMLKTALATPILDLPLTRLDDLCRDETAWETEVDRFSHYQRIWRHQGVLPMFRVLLQEFGVSARLLSIPGGERTLTNVLHLAELLQSASGSLDGEQALLRWLADMIRNPGGRSDEQILRLESDDHLIRVITIHKSKGLEYPLVFLPFICTFRRVTKRWSQVVTYHDGQGRLKVVQDPGDGDLKAADRERLAEDLRLLYVAVTRARFACWLGIGVMGRTTKKGENSHLHLSGLGYLLSPEKQIPTHSVADALAKVKGSCRHIAIATLTETIDNTYTPGEDLPPLAPAKTFTGRIPTDWWVASYSTILAGAAKVSAPVLEDDARIVPPDAAHSAVEDQLLEKDAELGPVSASTTLEPSIHNFPRGPQPGTFLHGILEWAAGEGFDHMARNRQHVEDRVQQWCTHRGWDQWTEMLAGWLRHLLQTPLTLPEDQGNVTLATLRAGNYQPELEFLFAAHYVDTRRLDRWVTADIVPARPRPQLEETTVNGMLKGFIDLAFCHQGRYYVMDYKSNYLGENEDAYGPDALTEAMLEHRYDLQYVLYTLAMHRLLKARLPAYDYRRHMGGAIYLFLRGISTDGQGVYIDKPPWPLIKRLDDYFAGREDGHGY